VQSTAPGVITLTLRTERDSATSVLYLHRRYSCVLISDSENIVIIPRVLSNPDIISCDQR